MPENCGRKPRMPMPDSTPLYWITSTPAFFLSTSVRSAAIVRSMSVASTTSIFCGVSASRDAMRLPVTTTSSEKPPGRSTMRSAGAPADVGIVTRTRAGTNSGSSAPTA